MNTLVGFFRTDIEKGISERFEKSRFRAVVPRKGQIKDRNLAERHSQ